MKLPNDKNINQWFDNLEIQPSPQAWDTLAQLLDEQLPVQPIQSEETKISKKNKSNRRPILLWFASAAIIALVCGIGFSILNQDQQPNQVVTHVEIKEPVKNLDNEFYTESDSSTKAIDLYHNIKSETTLASTKSTPSNFNDVNNNPTISYYNFQNEILDNAENNNENSSENLADSSLKLNWKNAKKQEFKLKEKDVLHTVERELIQEHSEKVLNSRYQKLEQIRMAVINRNYEE